MLSDRRHLVSLLPMNPADRASMQMWTDFWRSPAGMLMCGYCWSGGPCSSESLEMLESLDLAECADALDPAGLVWLKCPAAESAS